MTTDEKQHEDIQKINTGVEICNATLYYELTKRHFLESEKLNTFMHSHYL